MAAAITVATSKWPLRSHGGMKYQAMKGVTHSNSRRNHERCGMSRSLPAFMVLPLCGAQSWQWIKREPLAQYQAVRGMTARDPSEPRQSVHDSEAHWLEVCCSTYDNPWNQVPPISTATQVSMSTQLLSVNQTRLFAAPHENCRSPFDGRSPRGTGHHRCRHRC